MKRARLLILCLLCLQTICVTGQEKNLGEELAALIRNADDLRVVYEDLSDIQSDGPTGYQCLQPAGNQALAQAFADATLTLHRWPDGSDDPGGFGSSYMIIHVRKKGEIVGIMAMTAFVIHVMKPGKIWYSAEYKDAPRTDDSVSSEKSLIERRALGIILASVKQDGGWKAVRGNLKEFVPDPVD